MTTGKIKWNTTAVECSGTPHGFANFVVFSRNADNECMAQLESHTIGVAAVLLVTAVVLLLLCAAKVALLVRAMRAREQREREFSQRRLTRNERRLIHASYATPFVLAGMLAVSCCFLVAFAGVLLAQQRLSVDRLIVYFFVMFLPAQQLTLVAATIFSAWLLLFLQSMLRSVEPRYRQRMMFVHWFLSGTVLLFSAVISLLVFWRDSIPDRTFVILIAVGILLDELLYLSIAVKLWLSLGRFALKFYRCGSRVPLSAFARAMVGLWTWNACLALCIFVLSAFYLVLAFVSGLTVGMLVTVIAAIPFQSLFVCVCLSSMADSATEHQRHSALYFPLSAFVRCCSSVAAASHELDAVADDDDDEERLLFDSSADVQTSRSTHSIITTSDW